MVPSLRGKQMGEKAEAVADFIFMAPKSLWTVTIAVKLKDACSVKERQRDITLPTKARPVKAMVLQQSRMSATAEPYRWLSTKKLMLLNCGAGEDS